MILNGEWKIEERSYILSIVVIDKVSGNPLLFTAQSQKVNKKTDKLEFSRMYWGMNFEFGITVKPHKLILSVPSYWGWLSIEEEES
jgi:hypothetical protein